MTRPWVGGTIFFLLIAQAALADEDVVEQPIAPFRILDQGGDLFAHVRAQSEKQTYAALTQKESEFYAEEGIDLRARGYIYHPNLMEWDASVRLGLLQDDLTVNGQNLNTNGTLLGYNLSALLFKEKFISFHPFASQSQDTQARDFAPSVQTKDQRYGLETTTKGPFPASLLLEQVITHQSGDSLDVDKTTNHLRFTIADQRNPDWMTQLVYDHQDTAETDVVSNPGAPSSSLSLPAHIDELDLNNLWRFGPGPDKSSLTGTVHFLNQTGFYQNRDFLVDELLNLKHTPTFSTFYHILYDNDQVQSQPNDTLTGEAGFRQKVYDSLNITGRVDYSDNKFEGGSQSTEGGFLEFDYKKETPIGLYVSTLLLGLEDTKQTTANGVRPILNEPVTLTGITFVKLSQPGVVSGTLVVTSVDHTKTYIVGVDYTVQTLGAFTEIARLLPTTNITDGQTVLASYSVAASLNDTYTTDTLNWNNRINLKAIPVALYVNYHLHDQHLTSGQDPHNLDRIHDLLGGAELNWHDLLVALEYEKVDQILSPPSTAQRVRASYRRQFTRDFEGSIGGNFETLKYQDAAQFDLQNGKDFMNTLGGFLNLTYKIRANSLLRFRSEYIQTKGQQDTDLFRNSLSWEWSYEKLDFSVEGRYDLFDQEGTSGSQEVLMFNVRRKF
jgi:hypothetical protein